jgi:hypothetical protein
MTLDIVSRILADAVKRGLLTTNPAANRELRLKVTARRGNFLEADELLVLLQAAGMVDQQVSPRTLQRADRARELRASGRAWAEIADALRVAQSTAIWLVGRTLSSARPSARRALVATLGCAGLRNSEACDLSPCLAGARCVSGTPGRQQGRRLCWRGRPTVPRATTGLCRPCGFRPPSWRL